MEPTFVNRYPDRARYANKGKKANEVTEVTKANKRQIL